MSDLSPLITGQTVPDLQLPLVSGGMWSLRQDAADQFSLLIFYRGRHCPLCREQLRDAQSRLYDLSSRGVRVTAISTDTEDCALSTKREWGLDRLDIAFGLSIAQARAWGLYISTRLGTTSLGIEEPQRFNEPGLFLVRPDMTLYYTAIQSSPFARPPLSELIKAIDFVVANDYPPRGDVATVQA